MERRDKVDTIKGDTHDALDEMKERVKAGGEKVKRAVEGDRMPLGDRLASHVKEMGHDVKADYDKSKRDVRDQEV
ncbi:MAG TPA: hypothetical protein VK665_09255 [Candidatus Elarobacter sp.]|nr:hypothetical protein [Candidatus Elarobacter sp.]